MKELLKKHGITEKQVMLIRLVAEHPIYGALESSVGRVVPAALRHGVIQEVKIDTDKYKPRAVTDHQIGHPQLTGSSNVWYELGDRAIALMKELEPGWTYHRPVPR